MKPSIFLISCYVMITKSGSRPRRHRLNLTLVSSVIDTVLTDTYFSPIKIQSGLPRQPLWHIETAIRHLQDNSKSSCVLYSSFVVYRFVRRPLLFSSLCHSVMRWLSSRLEAIHMMIRDYFIAASLPKNILIATDEHIVLFSLMGY